ncbi:DUF6207 family protein [Streptomyces sp. AM8-1-1]|uniref:DUF6207 family protein n=1 Tax=Streptomyces sp. AM8-1-1 TaxID=3075825 RepID=UPI0028C3912D|nr:DUF6207 family protein [Streptomyces sp. AM8-1-1]WNO70145.1 DUF6207 family protein [Streptomyces sp. AM8-1-1]WNO76971.1 DUF6207 family protein [Streptomyces sp. AM8-1-1]
MTEPGLIVIDITAADAATALGAVAEMDSQWATSRPDEVRRVPGQAGVTLRMYADMRRSGLRTPKFLGLPGFSAMTRRLQRCRSSTETVAVHRSTSARSPYIPAAARPAAPLPAPPRL